MSSHAWVALYNPGSLWSALRTFYSTCKLNSKVIYETDTDICFWYLLTSGKSLDFTLIYCFGNENNYTGICEATLQTSWIWMTWDVVTYAYNWTELYLCHISVEIVEVKAIVFLINFLFHTYATDFESD